MTKPRNVKAMTVAQLWMIVAGAPDRRILWTRFEEMAADELDRRLAP